jgi:hypothetical protein
MEHNQPCKYGHLNCATRAGGRCSDEDASREEQRRADIRARNRAETEQDARGPSRAACVAAFHGWRVGMGDKMNAALLAGNLAPGCDEKDVPEMIRMGAEQVVRERDALLAACIAIEDTFSAVNADGTRKAIGNGIDADSPRGRLLAAIAKARG